MVFEDGISRNRLVLEKEEESANNRLLPVLCMIPDIMHLLNRTAERVIKILLMKGEQKHKQTLQTLETFKTSMESIVNSDAFRNNSSNDDDETDSNKFHTGKKWSYPTTDSTELVGDVKMTFSAARNFIKNLHLLYALCLPDDEMKDTIIQTIQTYREIMEIIQQKEDFSDEQISELVQKLNRFGDDWVNVAGIAGQTNYFHYLIAGHVVHFLREYRNFYRYQQQGWEALNSWMKIYFLHYTQRGGHGPIHKSYLKPMYRQF